VQEHAITRSVRDSALLLDLADAPTPGEPYAAPAKARPWLEEAGTPPGRLRIAFTREPLFADQTHPDCALAVDGAVRMLSDLGHELVEARPSFPRETLVSAYFVQVAAGVACDIEEVCRRAGVRPRSRDFEPATWMLGLIGWRLRAAALAAARATVMAGAREVAPFFETHDVFLTSTLARPPARVGELALSSSEKTQIAVLRRLPLRRLLQLALAEMGGEKLAYTPNTQLWNQTGQPAASVPLHWNEAGLPIGVQLVARFGGEATLFRLAAQLEAAHPWAQRCPPLGEAPPA
jgi:amidase